MPHNYLNEPIQNVARIVLSESPKRSESNQQNYERIVAGIRLYWGENFPYSFVSNGHVHEFRLRQHDKSEQDVLDLAARVQASIWAIGDIHNDYRCLLTGRHSYQRRKSDAHPDWPEKS